MVVIFYLLLPFFFITIFVFVLDFIGEAVTGSFDGGGDSPL